MATNRNKNGNNNSNSSISDEDDKIVKRKIERSPIKPISRVENSE